MSTEPVTPALVKCSGRWIRVTVWIMLISYLLTLTVAWAGPAYPVIDIPISTGAAGSECSLSDTPGNGLGPVINSHSNTFECKTANGQTVTKSSTPTSKDISQFASGFLHGLVEGIWQQVTGLLGLLFNIGPLVHLAQEMAAHPQQTLAAIGQVLHKQFASLAQIRQEIVCEPYSGGQLSGVALVVIASTVGTDGVGDVADLGNVSHELGDVAKDVAKDGTLEARIVTTAADAKEIGEDIANGKTVLVNDLKSLSNPRIGDIGEGYVIGGLKKQGYDQVVQVQNASGHGVDVIARKPDGTVKVIEVKTTTKDRAPDLSGDQKEGGAKFTESRLGRALSGRYGETAEANANEAQRWIKDAKEQGKLSYEVQPVFLRQGGDGVVTARLGAPKPWT